MGALASATMQARMVEQAKLLEPLSNARIALRPHEAVTHYNLIGYSGTDPQFNQMMREGLLMVKDFEVISRDQWKLLVRYFSERPDVNEEDVYVEPVPLVRSYELLGLGIRTQIEYFH